MRLPPAFKAFIWDCGHQMDSRSLIPLHLYDLRHPNINASRPPNNTGGEYNNKEEGKSWCEITENTAPNTKCRLYNYLMRLDHQLCHTKQEYNISVCPRVVLPLFNLYSHIDRMYFYDNVLKLFVDMSGM